jgi:hypothetical protein
MTKVACFKLICVSIMRNKLLKNDLINSLYTIIIVFCDWIKLPPPTHFDQSQNTIIIVKCVN